MFIPYKWRTSAAKRVWVNLTHILAPEYLKTSFLRMGSNSCCAFTGTISKELLDIIRMALNIKTSWDTLQALKSPLFWADMCARFDNSQRLELFCLNLWSRSNEWNLNLLFVIASERRLSGDWTEGRRVEEDNRCRDFYTSLRIERAFDVVLDELHEFIGKFIFLFSLNWMRWMVKQEPLCFKILRSWWMYLR